MSLKALHEASKQQNMNENEQKSSSDLKLIEQQMNRIAELQEQLETANQTIQKLCFDKEKLKNKVIEQTEHIVKLNESDLVLKENEELDHKNKVLLLKVAELQEALKKEKETVRQFQKPDGSIGGKIKRIRNLYGLTQKELGVLCGYNESTADVRISQYESNRKKPRDKALEDIAGAFEIDKSVFYEFDLSPMECMCHALFDMEDYHGLHPVEIDRKFYLEFGCKEERSIYSGSLNQYQKFLQNWDAARKYYVYNDNKPDEGKIREYELWKIKYQDGSITPCLKAGVSTA